MVKQRKMPSFFSNYQNIYSLGNEKSFENKIEENKFQINKKRIYEVAVVSTMSSGKSTFINALIGNDFLPSKNQACTARVTAILDDDDASSVTTHLLYPDGKYCKIAECDCEKVKSILLSESDSLADIIIECSIQGIRNVRKSLFIVDTPGVNNIADTSHEEITRRYLETMNSGLILYVMDSTQMTTFDHSRMIEYLRSIVQQKPNIQIIFLLNKADEIDPEKEPVDRVVSTCVDYLSERGFPSPYIFPVSSEAALLIKKAVNGIDLSKAEISRLKQYYEKFKPLDFSLSSYSYEPNQQYSSAEFVIGKRNYSARKLFAALENTGIPAVEREIEKRIIDQLKSRAPKIKKPSSDRKRG